MFGWNLSPKYYHIQNVFNFKTKSQSDMNILVELLEGIKWICSLELLHVSVLLIYSKEKKSERIKIVYWKGIYES